MMVVLKRMKSIMVVEGVTLTRIVMWSVLAALVHVVLAVIMTSSLMAFMRPSHNSACCCGGSEIVLHRQDLDPIARWQETLPNQVFSPSSNSYLRSGHGSEPNMLESNGIVGSVSRSEFPSVGKSVEVTVPRTIWQTARNRRDTPQYGTDLFNSWTKQNPGWDHFFMDDEDVEAFVAAHYNASVLQAYKDLPLGVMKADVFRYMVIHQYGGVYADMDTEAYQPVAAWAPQGCRFAVATENEIHFCQWAFAAVPGHGALGRVLDLVLQRMISRVYKEYIARGDEEFVHEVTGPAVFTEGILDFLGVAHASHNDTQLYALLATRRKEFRAAGVCLLTWAEMQDMLANQYSSWHMRLQKGSWSSWTRERARLMKESAEQRSRGEQEESQAADELEGGEAPGEPEVAADVPTDEQQGEDGQGETVPTGDLPTDEQQREDGPGETVPADEQQGEAGHPA